MVRVHPCGNYPFHLAEHLDLQSLPETHKPHKPNAPSPTLSSASPQATFPIMSRHHPDLVMCRKQPGIAIGRLCDKCDGKCPVCDSYVRPTTLVRICDECSFGNYQNKCVVCGGEGISDAFYCFECTRLERDRDGCPKIINLGSSRTDLFYQKKNFRNH
ncbi:PHF5-like protein-domain-containing protein [Peziza echinospora]|nr:PHF5-like protein-domain-containing protein [Peziza echinospora]